jgi:hypothetical protein
MSFGGFDVNVSGLILHGGHLGRRRHSVFNLSSARFQSRPAPNPPFTILEERKRE